MTVTVRFCKTSTLAKLPTKGTVGSSGFDVYADLNNETLHLKPLERVIVSSGVKVVIPFGYELQVRPRSGLSAKSNIRICNSPGTIDSDYLNNIGIILQNIGDTPEQIKHGDRIAQLVLQRVPDMYIEEVTEEDYQKFTSNRGTGGFGSTGI